MLELRCKYVAFVFLATTLWSLCGLGVLGMYDVRTSQQAMAKVTPIFRGNAEHPNVALMFNVDWGEEYIPGILETLGAKEAPVTFFLTGYWAEKNSELVRQIVEAGHELGNHGGVHSHVEGMCKEDLHRLIQSGEARIMAASGVRSPNLFAPPYGEWTEETVLFASEIGYATILWTADTVDWRLPPADSIWKRALSGADSGALILMHPTEPTSIALPDIIDGIRQKGFTLTTVSQCISGPPVSYNGDMTK